jgi:GNAT superfamily N-acetyltransferase
MMIVTGFDGKEYMLRKLETTDGAMLSVYFNGLSEITKVRFGPHPLTEDFAFALCGKLDDTADRFVIFPKGKHEIVGYFILEFELSPHESGRYLSQGVVLEQRKDVLFAPSVADAFQNCGLASAVMPELIAHCRRKGARSLVLMGGTQATNARAIAFYEKFGFVKYGGYQTEVFNHDMRLVF